MHALLSACQQGSSEKGKGVGRQTNADRCGRMMKGVEFSVP